jgi:hypothetical protein
MTLDIISEATMGRDYGLQKTPYVVIPPQLRSGVREYALILVLSRGCSARDHPLLVLMMTVFEELSQREINPLRYEALKPLTVVARCL